MFNHGFRSLLLCIVGFTATSVLTGCCTGDVIVAVDRPMQSSGYAHVYMVPDRDSEQPPTGPDYKVEAGGVIILSPSRILLTNHQINQRQALIGIGDLGHFQTKVVHSNDARVFVEGVGESKLGWEVRSIDPRVHPSQVAELIGHHLAEPGSECFIPISENYFPLYNPDVCSMDDEGNHFVRGTLVDLETEKYPQLVEPFIGENRFAIRVNAVLDMRGSSGFPVLAALDQTKKPLVIGLAIAGIHHPELDYTWVIASEIPDLSDQRSIPEQHEHTAHTSTQEPRE